jgi:hypothetical protein
MDTLITYLNQVHTVLLTQVYIDAAFQAIFCLIFTWLLLAFIRIFNKLRAEYLQDPDSFSSDGFYYDTSVILVLLFNIASFALFMLFFAQAIRRLLNPEFYVVQYLLR